MGCNSNTPEMARASNNRTRPVQLPNSIMDIEKYFSPQIKLEEVSVTPETVESCRAQKENVPQIVKREKATRKRPRATRKKLNASIVHSAQPQSPSNEKYITDYFQPRRSHRKTKAEVMKSKQLLMEEKVVQEDESGFAVVKYEDKGRGVVSLVDLKAGDFVLEYAGALINLKEARRREQMYANDSSVGCYMYYFQHENANYCVDATPESNRLGRLINHSIKGANLKTKSVTIAGRPCLVFLAKRDISCGEELLYDYGDRSKVSLESHPWLKK